MKPTNLWIRLISAVAAAVLVLTPVLPARAAEVAESVVLINEIESNDADGGNDWV